MEKTSSRWWDFPSAILLVAAILVSTWRLTITNWTPHVGYVSNMALGGTLLGLALGQSRFGKHAVRLLSLGYTLVFLAWQLTGFYDNKIELTDRLYNIGNRILYSFGQYAANKPVRDELFVVFLLSLGYWIVGLIAGYSLTRRANYIAAVLPAAVAMLIVNQYDPGHPGRIWFIAVYLMLALGLLGRQQFVRRRLDWIKNKVQLAPETAQELSTAALVVAAALVMMAWLVPAQPSAALSDLWHELSEPWEATRERWRKAFASVESDTTRIEYVRDTLFLGDNATLDKSLVFTVNAPAEALTLPRRYWRGRVYDHYENGEWTSGERAVVSFSPEEDEFVTPDNILRDEYEFIFTAYIQDQAILYMPGQPLWVSHGADARLVEISSGRQDILALLADPMIQAGETYTTRSALANPSIEELRSATTVYPLWVQDRYLQLPEDFPASIRNYAEQITAGLETPYDKAEAITNALRSEIAYKTVITPPTDGSDVIEWFLFEGKEGYCNYYATAEVLMLRSLGIPARMAVGFSRGGTSPGSLMYTVRNDNSHAWPEVYFPAYGWVEFEPTGNQDPLVRPEAQTSDGIVPPPITPLDPGEAAVPDTDLPEQPNSQTASSSILKTLTRYLPAIGWSLALVLGGVFLVRLNRRVPLARGAAGYLISASERHGLPLPRWLRKVALYTLLDPIERSFHAINVSLGWLGKSPALHYTAADRAAELKKLLPEAAEEIDALQREHQASLYSPRVGNAMIARRAGRTILWKTLRAKFARTWA